MKNIVFNILYTLMYPKRNAPVRKTGAFVRQHYCKNFVLRKENVSRQPNYFDDIIDDDPVWYKGRSIDKSLKSLLQSDYHLRRQ